MLDNHVYYWNGNALAFYLLLEGYYTITFSMFKGDMLNDYVYYWNCETLAFYLPLDKYYTMTFPSSKNEYLKRMCLLLEW